MNAVAEIDGHIAIIAARRPPPHGLALHLRTQAESSPWPSAVHAHHQGPILVERSEPGGGSPFVETVRLGDRLGLHLTQAVGSPPELSAVELEIATAAPNPVHQPDASPGQPRPAAPTPPATPHPYDQRAHAATQAMRDDRPRSSSDRRVDAALAARGEYLARRDGVGCVAVTAA